MLTSDILGGVTGTVFLDDNANGVVDAGEEIENALLQLYEDTNNNNSFDPGTDMLVASTNSNASGIYEFTGLTSDNYFAVQPAQNVAGLALSQLVSPRQALVEPARRVWTSTRSKRLAHPRPISNHREHL